MNEYGIEANRKVQHAPLNEHHHSYRISYPQSVIYKNDSIFARYYITNGPYIHIFLTFKGKKTMKTTINSKLGGNNSSIITVGTCPVYNDGTR